MHEEVVGPLVRVIEEAADEERWALTGAASCRAQGCEAASPNLEFMTTPQAVRALAEMLDVAIARGHGPRVRSERLEFMRGPVPVFVFGSPVFHGRYDSLTPHEIPSLWDALVSVPVGHIALPVTPLEWELLLAVVLGNEERIRAVGAQLRERGPDGRLLTRLMREGHVQQETEDAVWAVLEGRAEADA